MGNSASGYGQSYGNQSYGRMQSPMGSYQGGFRPNPMQSFAPQQQYGTRPMQMNQAVGSPPSAFGKGFNPMPAPGFEPAPGFDVQPQDASQDVQSIASPASAFGFGAPPQAPAPQAPKDPFANSMLYQNPYGFSQQQLGPSFNPMGSAQGGYFNGNQYVPHTGNSRNGLDRMARIGLNWNGQPFGKVGA